MDSMSPTNSIFIYVSYLGIVIYVTVGMTGDDSTHTIHSTISKEFRETQEVGTLPILLEFLCLVILGANHPMK